ncbi:NAD(P)-dependent oxidoreductase [Devosia sp. Leaf64]|uniref:NAD-dependent epimerase/dehydratase family protein n=1 Tax=Devosia sp. Leaf64 TaxID=1736229 RepID=UPI000B11ED44|nr:NAD(P)-dependent oxidoreductase [Devosia sp. Leaf64]
MSDGAIVVFGGSGFVGTHLVRRLKRLEPDRPVIIFDRRAPKTLPGGVQFIEGDVRRSGSFELPDNVSQIYNLAAVHTTPGHPTHEYYETNVLGALNITEYARRHGINSILFTSSISVYGPSEQTKSEHTPVAPESAYGWSKWLAEEIHRSWLAEKSERRLVVCRPAVIFGPGEGGNFTRLASLLKRGIFVYPGRKDTIKACFYVEDLIQTFEYALKHESRYILYNGCYPDRYTLQDIVETFRKNHFPGVKTILVPKTIMLAAAAALRPASAAGLGIHPDRIMKLVRSTDITPGWLQEQNQAKNGQLSGAIDRWHEQSPTFI